MPKHTILESKVYVDKRAGSPKWQCAAFLNGKNHRTTTKTHSLSQAKNCRTSVEMIEKHYAVHLKNALDAAAINVGKSR